MKKILSIILVAVILISSTSTLAIAEGIPEAFNSIEISGTNELYITFAGEETHTVQIVNVSDITAEAEYITCVLVTADGDELSTKYYSDFSTKNGSLAKNVSVEIGGVKSNELVTNRWFMARNSIERAVVCTAMYRFTGEKAYDYEFTGYDSANEEINIDDVIYIATCLCDSKSEGRDSEYLYFQNTVEATEKYVISVFGISVDAKASRFYDENTGDVIIKVLKSIDANYDMGDMSFDGYGWSVQAELTDLEEKALGKLQVVLDTNGYIGKILWKSPVLKGDVNGDGKVSGIDVRVLLQYAAGLSKEIDIEAADINSDGRVSGLDARLALQIAAGIVE